MTVEICAVAITVQFIAIFSPATASKNDLFAARASLAQGTLL
jgi:hypothetical protein